MGFTMILLLTYLQADSEKCMQWNREADRAIVRITKNFPCQRSG